MLKIMKVIEICMTNRKIPKKNKSISSKKIHMLAFKFNIDL